MNDIYSAAMKEAEQLTLYDLAYKILQGSYTTGIHDRMLLDRLEKLKEDAAQGFVDSA